MLASYILQRKMTGDPSHVTICSNSVLDVQSAAWQRVRLRVMGLESFLGFKNAPSKGVLEMCAYAQEWAPCTCNMK